MRLPVTHASPPPVFWVREFARMGADWCMALGDSTELAGATVFASGGWPDCADANSVANAWLPVGVGWAELSAEVAAIFSTARATCLRWQLNPSMPPGQTDPIATALTAAGWTRSTRPLLRWENRPLASGAVHGYTIVPARSAYPVLDAFYESRGDPTAIVHLDDPQVESWVALSAGKAVAVATVQISGRSAVLRDWFVGPTHRDRGLGRAVLARVTDLCHRADIAGLLAVAGNPATPAPAGFKPVADWTEFHPPVSRPRELNTPSRSGISVHE